MPFTIPDKGEGDNDIQSILFQEQLEILVAGIQGLDCVVSGCAVTGGADMTPAVAKGAVLSNGTLFAIAAADVTITAADGTHPRIDLIVVTSAGALAVRAGTAAAAPKPPARTANDVVLAAVYVPATDTTIATTQITDMRVIRDRNMTLKRTTSAVTFNTTAAIQTYFTITLPSGLFLAGRQLRVTCGGHYLFNSGTPQLTLTISYNGTAMFADSTATITLDADRGAWFLDLVLNASANNAQQLNGILLFTGHNSTRIPPTSGTAGQMHMGEPGMSSPLRGTAAVDSDAGDRAFTVQFTMSVSHANNEMSMDFGTAVLL